MKKSVLCAVLLGCLALKAMAATADDYYHQGLQAYQAGKWGEAVTYFEGAVQIDPQHWQAYQLLGYSYYRINDSAKALQYCDQSLRFHPNNPTLQSFVDKLRPQVMPAPAISESPGLPAPPSPGVADPSLPTLPAGPVGNVNSVYLSVGLDTPYAPDGFKLGWSSGPGFGAGYGFGLSRRASIVLDGSYDSFPMTSSYYAGYGISSSGGGIHTLDFRLNAKLNFTDQDNPVVFYGLVGLGPSVVIVDSLNLSYFDPYSGTTVSATAPGYSETDLGTRFGLGIDIRMGKHTSLFIESDGKATFVSQAISYPETSMINGLFRVGLKFDNK